MTSNTSPGMEASANKFVEIDTIIDGVAKNMYGQIEAMGWGGTAGPAFKQVMAAWNLEFAKIQGHMDEMAELLKGQAVDILSVEEENVLNLNKIFNLGTGSGSEASPVPTDFQPAK